LEEKYDGDRQNFIKGKCHGVSLVVVVVVVVVVNISEGFLEGP
jgi:hypothetical protein